VWQTARTLPGVRAEEELETFVSRFAPQMQGHIRECRAKLQSRLPHATQLVWDNYNFLVISFGPTRRPSDAIFSLAANRRGVSLCFLQGALELSDPTGILRGSGKAIRNIALDGPDDLDRADVDALIDAAIDLAPTPMATADDPELVVRSVSKKQRPRR
jgi:hypothetical protein